MRHEHDEGHVSLQPCNANFVQRNSGYAHLRPSMHFCNQTGSNPANRRSISITLRNDMTGQFGKIGDRLRQLNSHIVTPLRVGQELFVVSI